MCAVLFKLHLKWYFCFCKKTFKCAQTKFMAAFIKLHNTLWKPRSRMTEKKNQFPPVGFDSFFERRLLIVSEYTFFESSTQLFINLFLSSALVFQDSSTTIIRSSVGASDSLAADHYYKQLIKSLVNYDLLDSFLISSRCALIFGST